MSMCDRSLLWSATAIMPRELWLPVSTVASAATSEAALEMRFEAMANRLERSEILFEFLAIMRSAPILPLPLRPVQPLLVRAAIDLTPHWLRTIVRLTDHGLNAWEAGLVRQIAAFADRLVLETNPAVQACRRMRLPANYLYSTQ